MSARPGLAAGDDAMRVGWCPGALRPMRAGDGWLVRLKPRGHCLTLQQARAVAGLALRHGNGALTVTGRGNLQLRGVEADALAPLVTALDGLGLLDAESAGEAVRNVTSSPLAGHDPSAVLDLAGQVDALEDRLATDADLWRLPAKFSWCVDEAGALGLGDVPADIRFTAFRAPGGDGALAVTLAGGEAWARCRSGEAVAVAARLAAAFLALCAEAGLAPHRMRDLVGAAGAAAVLRRAGLAREPGAAPASVPPARVTGILRTGEAAAVAASPAFGLLPAGALDAFASAAERAGGHAIRLTPWRGLLAAGLAPPAAIAMADALAATTLILDPADPRLAVAACVGAPACARATTPVPADAARLAAALPPAAGAGLRLHVSGCAKGCAGGDAAPVALVGRAGAYDLVPGGRADGEPVRRGLPLAQALAGLAAWEEAA